MRQVALIRGETTTGSVSGVVVDSILLKFGRNVVVGSVNTTITPQPIEPNLKAKGKRIEGIEFEKQPSKIGDE